MRAMILDKLSHQLQQANLPIPEPKKGQLLIRVSTCGICRTDLHIIDGELPAPKLPLILGHQIVGIVSKLGEGVQAFKIGDRVGVPWLGGCCGICSYCLSKRENLCEKAVYTGYQVDGGFAEYCVANAEFTFSIPSNYSDLEAAPLLCAGLIGYRAYRMTESAKRIGFYGFGSSAHILLQIASHEGRQVFAFTREGDLEAQNLARELGAIWAGNSKEETPEPLDAAIIFAPVGHLVPVALNAVTKGGIVVCAGIYMSDIPSFPYSLLWNEKILRTVANLTRKDGVDFLALASRIQIKTHVTSYPLEQVNEALSALRNGTLTGSGVIIINGA